MTPQQLRQIGIGSLIEVPIENTPCGTTVVQVDDIMQPLENGSVRLVCHRPMFPETSFVVTIAPVSPGVRVVRKSDDAREADHLAKLTAPPRRKGPRGFNPPHRGI